MQVTCLEPYTEPCRVMLQFTCNKDMQTHTCIELLLVIDTVVIVVVLVEVVLVVTVYQCGLEILVVY